MQILAIVSEYNPFHNGHAEQLRVLREQFGDNALIITCMSGSFVQRGEAAIMDKQRRAKAALSCGINLVLELPALFSCSSADYFAIGAIKTLQASGLPLTLCFGSESGQIQVLRSLAQLRVAEPPAFKAMLQTALESGQSYAAAQASAASGFIQSPAAEVFFSAKVLQELQKAAIDNQFWLGSNNQLATAYLAALERYPTKPPMRTFTHPRSGAHYLEEELAEQFSSATAIRETLKKSRGIAESLLALRHEMPAAALATLLESMQENALADEELLAGILLSRIRAAQTEELECYQGWDEGLAERLKRIAATRFPEPHSLWRETVQKAKSKRFSAARVQRACIALLLGIKKGETAALLEAGAPFYIRALAADKNGRYLLRRMRKSTRLPIFTKHSDYLEIPFTEAAARRSAEIDQTAADLHSLICHSYPGADFDKPMHLG